MSSSLALPDKSATLADVGEDGFIAHIQTATDALNHASIPQTPRPAPILVPIGDDAAILSPLPDRTCPILTADAFIEGTHFIMPSQVCDHIRIHHQSEFCRQIRPALANALHLLSGAQLPPQHFYQQPYPLASPELDFHDLWCLSIGHRLAMANLSDIAAMGGIPQALTLTIAAPATCSARHLLLIAAGVAQAGHAAQAPLVGGDTVSTTGPISLSLQALGGLPPGLPPALRKNARPGDTLYITGAIGSGALAPALFLGQTSPPPQAAPSYHTAAVSTIVEHLTKPAQVTVGPILAALLTPPATPTHQGPTITDISDGILREAQRIARAAHVEIEIHAEKLPQLPVANEVTAHLSPEERAALFLASGEEWELMFSTPHPILPDTLPTQTTITAIGQIIRAHQGGLVRVLYHGEPFTAPDTTYQHFSATHQTKP